MSAKSCKIVDGVDGCATGWRSARWKRLDSVRSCGPSKRLDVAEGVADREGGRAGRDERGGGEREAAETVMRRAGRRIVVRRCGTQVAPGTEGTKIQEIQEG